MYPISPFLLGQTLSFINVVVVALKVNRTLLYHKLVSVMFKMKSCLISNVNNDDRGQPVHRLTIVNTLTTDHDCSCISMGESFQD